MMMMAKQGRLVSDQDVAAFQADGAVAVRGLLSREWIGALRDVFDGMKERATDMTNYYSSAPSDKKPPKSSMVKDDVWMSDPAMRRFLFESPIAQAAAEVMGSAVAQIYEDLLIYKAAGTDTPTPWHQDEPQWPLTGTQMASVWMALDPVTRDTGALRFVRSSHRGPMYVPYVHESMRSRLDDDMPFFTGGPRPDIDADPARFPVLCFDTEPGDVIIFHPRTLHAAIGSDERRDRRTFSIRFIGDDVRWQPKATVMYEWLKDSRLEAGDLVTGDRFPEIWRSAELTA